MKKSRKEQKMLKLNASYSKKVPAEGEYTSQSYHASIEVELPDGLNQNQLQARIHDTFALVKESVEAELHGNANSQVRESAPMPMPQNVPQNVGNPPVQHDVPASPKQLKFMLDLARNKGITPAQIAAQYGVATVDQLTRTQCSSIINSWRAA
jgi:hypothetical protein